MYIFDSLVRNVMLLMKELFVLVLMLMMFLLHYLGDKGEIIANMDADEDVTLKDVTVVAKEVVVEKTVEIQKNADVEGRQAESQAQIYQIDLEHADK
nr:hypothetical protein [Tanacetum cinerariifolium]